MSDILSGNIAICKMLGWKECLTHDFDRYGYIETVDGYITPFLSDYLPDRILYEYNHSAFEYPNTALKFHEDWSWIMLAINFIKEQTDDCSFLLDLPLKTPIEQVFNNVVEFATTYNVKKTR